MKKITVSYYITVTKTGNGWTHGTPYYGHEYVLLKCRGNVVMRIGIQQLRQVCRYRYRCFIKVSLLYLQYKIHKKIRRSYIHRAILKRIMRNYVKNYLHVCLYTIKHPVDAEQPTPSKSSRCNVTLPHHDHHAT